MIWEPQHVFQDFLKVVELAGCSLRDEIKIEVLPAPHAPTSLPPGYMAVYTFTYRDRVLKVGKVNAKSGARFRSQHYSANSSGSNLASSLISEGVRLGVPALNEETVGDWIRKNTDRVNYLLPVALGPHVLNLLEAFLHCRLSPEFEGYASQRSRN